MGGRVRSSMGLEVGELLAPHSLESHCPFLAMRRLLQLPLFRLLEVPQSLCPQSLRRESAQFLKSLIP